MENYLLSSVPPDGNNIWTDHDHDRWLPDDQLGLDYPLLDDDFVITNNRQPPADSSEVDAHHEGMDSVLPRMLPAMGADQPSLDQSPGLVGANHTAPASVGADQAPPPLSNQNPALVGAYQAPPPSTNQNPDATIQAQGFVDSAPAVLMPAHEIDELAEMLRVAARCGEDDAPTVWSDEEHKQLLGRLHLHAGDDAVIRCFKIAFHLPRKTALDVALRCRWLQDKTKTVPEEAESAQQDGDRPKSNKVKVPKVARIRNKPYSFSEEAINSKSTKELIRDNIVLLKRIEENLRTGQLENTADYFYYVKTNMDAIEKRGNEFSFNIAMPPIDEEGLEEILRTRLNSS